MNKLTLLSFLIYFSFSSFSQNTFPSNGNVGINTATPSARLDVNGNAIIDSCLRVKDSMLVDKDLRTKGKFYVEDKAYFLKVVTLYEKIVVMGNINGENNINAANNVNADNNLNIGNNANVSNRLTVSGRTVMEDEVKMTGIGTIPNVNNPNVEILARTPNGQVYRVTIDDIITMMYSKDCGGVIQDIPSPAWNNGLNKIFVNYACADVKVGIKTSDPQYFLDVREMAFLSRLKVGVLSADQSGMINGFDPTNSRDLIQLGVLNATTGNQSDVRFSVSNKGAIYGKNLGSEPTFEIHNGSNHAIVVYDDAGEKICQLQNDGLLRARGVKVDLEVWPDYVFDEDYVLMTLNEVALYIEKNHHLPGLPTAKFIEENGLNLGDIQKLQMEKIEELTLYTIQQDQQITELQNENEELKSELNQLKSEVAEIKEMLSGK